MLLACPGLWTLLRIRRYLSGWLRQIHSFFRNRSPDQMLATAAPWTSPWLPPGYEQNFWNGALARRPRTQCRLAWWRRAAPPDQKSDFSHVGTACTAVRLPRIRRTT